MFRLDWNVFIKNKKKIVFIQNGVALVSNKKSNGIEFSKLFGIKLAGGNCSYVKEGSLEHSSKMKKRFLLISIMLWITGHQFKL